MFTWRHEGKPVADGVTLAENACAKCGYFGRLLIYARRSPGYPNVFSSTTIGAMVVCPRCGNTFTLNKRKYEELGQIARDPDLTEALRQIEAAVSQQLSGMSSDSTSPDDDGEPSPPRWLTTYVATMGVLIFAAAGLVVGLTGPSLSDTDCRGVLIGGFSDEVCRPQLRTRAVIMCVFFLLAFGTMLWAALTKSRRAAPA